MICDPAGGVGALRPLRCHLCAHMLPFNTLWSFAQVAGDKIVLRFNTTLLASDRVLFKGYNKSNNASATQVLFEPFPRAYAEGNADEGAKVYDPPTPTPPPCQLPTAPECRAVPSVRRNAPLCHSCTPFTTVGGLGPNVGVRTF